MWYVKHSDNVRKETNSLVLSGVDDLGKEMREDIFILLCEQWLQHRRQWCQWSAVHSSHRSVATVSWDLSVDISSPPGQHSSETTQRQWSQRQDRNTLLTTVFYYKHVTPTRYHRWEWIRLFQPRTILKQWLRHASEWSDQLIFSYQPLDQRLQSESARERGRQCWPVSESSWCTLWSTILVNIIQEEETLTCSCCINWAPLVN